MSAKTIAVAIAATLLALPALAEIEVHDAYAITSRPGAPTGAAFMMIQNPGGPDDHLVSAASPVAELVQLHTHVMDANGVAQMIEVVEGWDLPADGELSLERGGMHIMFMGLHDTLVDGQEIPVTLNFATAGQIEITVTVDLSRLTEDAMDQGSMDHGDMPAEGGEDDHGG